MKAPCPVYSLNKRKATAGKKNNPVSSVSPIQRAEWCGLFDKTIKAKRESQGERDPGKRSVGNGEIKHSQTCQPYRQPLDQTQSFPKYDHAQQNTEQRIDIVAKTRLDHKTIINRPDISEPINTDQDRCNKVNSECF